MVADALRWNMNAGWNEVVPCPFPYFINLLLDNLS